MGTVQKDCIILRIGVRMEEEVKRWGILEDNFVKGDHIKRKGYGLAAGNGLSREAGKWPQKEEDKISLNKKNLTVS